MFLIVLTCNKDHKYLKSLQIKLKGAVGGIRSITPPPRGAMGRCGHDALRCDRRLVDEAPVLRYDGANPAGTDPCPSDGHGNPCDRMTKNK